MPYTTLLPFFLAFLAICLTLAMYLLDPRPHRQTLDRADRLEDVEVDISRRRHVPRRTNEELSSPSDGTNRDDADQGRGQTPNIPRRPRIRWSDSQQRNNHVQPSRPTQAHPTNTTNSTNTHTPSAPAPPPPRTPSPQPPTHTNRIFFSPLTLNPTTTPLLHTLHLTTPPLSAHTIQTILRQHMIDSGLAFADPGFGVPVNRDGTVSVRVQYGINDAASEEWDGEDDGEAWVRSLPGSGGTRVADAVGEEEEVRVQGQGNGVGGTVAAAVEMGRLRRRSGVEDLSGEFAAQGGYRGRVDSGDRVDGAETGRDTGTGVDTSTRMDTDTEAGADAEVEEDGWMVAS